MHVRFRFFPELYFDVQFPHVGLLHDNADMTLCFDYEEDGGHLDFLGRFDILRNARDIQGWTINLTTWIPQVPNRWELFYARGAIMTVVDGRSCRFRLDNGIVVTNLNQPVVEVGKLTAFVPMEIPAEECDRLTAQAVEVIQMALFGIARWRWAAALVALISSLAHGTR